jgi:hypothetical protein
MELNTITKIYKYRRLHKRHKRHHFILMAMEVHSAFEHDMDRFIKECALTFGKSFVLLF